MSAVSCSISRKKKVKAIDRNRFTLSLTVRYNCSNDSRSIHVAVQGVTNV